MDIANRFTSNSDVAGKITRIQPEERFAVDYPVSDEYGLDHPDVNWPLWSRTNFISVPIQVAKGDGVPEFLQHPVERAHGWLAASTLYIGYDPQRDIWRSYEQWQVVVNKRPEGGSQTIFSQTMREFDAQQSLEDAISFAAQMYAKGYEINPNLDAQWNDVRDIIMASKNTDWREAAKEYGIPVDVREQAPPAPEFIHRLPR